MWKDDNINNLFGAIKRHFVKCSKPRVIIKNSAKRSLGKSITIVSFVASSVGGVKLLAGTTVANCAKKSPTKDSIKLADEDAKFDWYLFYKFLLPDVWLMFLAVVVSIPFGGCLYFFVYLRYSIVICGIMSVFVKNYSTHVLIFLHTKTYCDLAVQVLNAKGIITMSWIREQVITSLNFTIVISLMHSYFFWSSVL